MQTVKLELDEPFGERIERLKHELALALRWDRPSILLTVYASEFVRADAEAALEAWLREQGQAVAQVRVTGPDDPTADVPRFMHEWPDRERTVFFVSGLGRGAPTTWSSLNVRREYLVEGRIRAVFWLTEGEAAALPRLAPDFWVFRHRAVEFVEPPEMGRAIQWASELAWAGFERQLPPEERRARIAFRERLLFELSDVSETADARAELHYTLGGLHYFGREHETALKYIQTALNLAERLENIRLQAGSHNGLGLVYHDIGRHEEAIAAFQRATKLDPADATPHNNLGLVYRDLNRHEEAIAAHQRAIELDPNFAPPHNGLGTVYRDLGRYEEAIAAYHRAIELDPNHAYLHNNLGAVYRDLSRYEEAIATYQRAIELDPNNAFSHIKLAGVYRHIGDADAQAHYVAEAQQLLKPNDHYNLACLESVTGNVDAALEHLAKALEKTPGGREWARRDPDLAFIRDDPRFRELVGSTPDGRNAR